MATDSPDWTGNVWVSGGSITATIDTGGGPVQVSVQGTATVEFASAQEVTITGIAQVEFSSAQEVFFNATGPVSVQNNSVPTTELVFIGSQQYVNQTIPASGTFYSDVTGTDTVLLDGVVFFVQFETYNPGPGAWGLGGIVNTYVDILADPRMGNPYGQNVNVQTFGSTSEPTDWTGTNGHLGVYGPILFGKPVPSNLLEFQLKNIYTASLTDSWTIFAFGIRAQVSINNTDSAPAQMQPAVGEFSSVGTPLSQPTTVTATQATFIDAVPGYCTKLWLSVQGNGVGASTLYVIVGANEVDAVVIPQNGSARLTYDFGQGANISSGGIQLRTSANTVTVGGGLVWYATAGAVVPSTLS